MRNKILGIALIAAVVVAMILAGRYLSRGQEAKAPARTVGAATAAIPVYTHKVEARPFVEHLVATGSVLAEEAVELTSEVAGKVVAVRFEEGTRVNKDDILVKLDDSELQAELARTLSQAELAELQAARQKELLAVQSSSQESYDVALNEVRVIEAQTAFIRARLAKTEIRAPFDGQVGLRHVSVGAYLTPGSRIASLQDITTVKVEFSVAERHMDRLSTGNLVKVTVAGSAEPFTGTVYAIEPRIDPATRTIRLRARAENPGGRIFPGAFATVDLELREIPNAIFVPAGALIAGLNQQTVFVNMEGKAQVRVVETGLRLDRDVQITSGLRSGDELITSGQLQLRPGMPVRPVERAAEVLTP
ncbi:MAG TPA: efflux RND transporter periplasmic adaptor subunit [Opitutaceae bacterium]|nr:efflux RND transporter periplasmic adaptor subunit [Opitutaceae bacterium]